MCKTSGFSLFTLLGNLLDWNSVRGFGSVSVFNLYYACLSCISYGSVATAVKCFSNRSVRKFSCLKCRNVERKLNWDLLSHIFFFGVEWGGIMFEIVLLFYELVVCSILVHVQEEGRARLKRIWSAAFVCSEWCGCNLTDQCSHSDFFSSVEDLLK